MTQQDAFALEATRGTAAVATMYKFGQVHPSKNMPVSPEHIQEVNEIETQGVFSETISAGNAPLDNLPISYCPVNGLPFWHMMGKVTADTPSAGIYDITQFTTGRKPSISVYSENKNYGKYQAAGHVLESLDWSFANGLPLTIGHKGPGMAHGVSTATPTITFPDSISSVFDQLDATYGFLWDGDLYAIEAISGTLNSRISRFLASGIFGELSENASISHIVTVIFKRGVNCANILADKGTSKAIRCKINKAADTTKYWDFQCSAAMWKSLKPECIIGTDEQYVGIFVMGAATHFYVKDGITTAAHYGL